MDDIEQQSRGNGREGQGDFVVPKHFNFSTDVIDYWARIKKGGQRSTETPALWWIDGAGKEVKWTFQDVSLNSKRAANVLTKDAGITRGDRVVVILPRLPEYWLMCVACLRTGSVFVPFPFDLGMKELGRRLLAVKPSCIITWSGYLEQLHEEIAMAASSIPAFKAKILIGSCSGVELRKGWVIFDELFEKASQQYEAIKTLSSEPAQIYFSSGTTGNAKMIEHSHGSLGLGSAGMRKEEYEFTREDLVWCYSSTGWILSMLLTFGPWSLGAGIFVHFADFTPKELLATLQCYPVTSIWLGAAKYARLVLEDLKSCSFLRLNHCATGGEVISPRIITLWKEATGLDVKIMYGQTEMQRLCSKSRKETLPLGSVGKPLPGITLAVLDEKGKQQPPGLQGEIAIQVKPHQPVGMFTRYVDNPKETSAVIRGDYYLTGDLGRQDEDGFVYVDCRKDDMIFNEGDMINPVEVENCLTVHPAVSEAAVVSCPPPASKELEIKERAKAFVVVSSDFKDQRNDDMVKQLQDHVIHNTAGWMKPQVVEFVDDIPRTISGKIKRKELRLREWATTIKSE